MKFNVNSQELVSMLKVVTKGVIKDDSSFIYFKITEGKLETVSRCNSAYFSGTVNITNAEMGEDETNVHYVDGETLKKILSVLPTSPVQLTFEVNDETRSYVIKYTGNKFKLAIVDNQNEIPVPEMNTLGLVKADDFMSTISPILKVINSDFSSHSHASSCLHLTFTEDNILVMGTDRFTIAELQCPFDIDNPENELEPILVSHPQAILLTKPVEVDEMLTLVESDIYFGYKDTDGSMSLVAKSVLKPLNYLPIKKMMSDEQFVTVNTADIKEALSTINKLTAKKELPITLSFKKDEAVMNVVSITGDLMSIPLVNFELAEDMETPFLLNRIHTALLPIDTDLLRLQWASNEHKGNARQIVPFTDEDTERKGVFVSISPHVRKNG